MKLKFLPLLAAALFGGSALHAQCSTNMVDDPTGALGNPSWTFTTNGDNGALATNDNGDDCFVFSSNFSTVSQMIDLELTFTTLELSTQPNITFSQKVKTYSGASCSTAAYTVQVILYDVNNVVLESWNSGTQNTTSNSVWQTIEHSFASYSGTPRYVEIINAGADCTNNSSANEGAEMTDVSLVAVTPDITTGTVTGDQNVNTVKSYDDPSTCTQTGVVLSTGGGSNLGSTTVVSTLDGVVQTFNGEPYVPRHYEIEPTTQLAATVTLFVDQADFDAYNLARGAFPALPSTGDVNDPDLANLTITAFHGTPVGGYDPINYSGTRELIPNSDITPVWNAGANRWEFTFTVSSFSGFFFGSGMTALNISMGDVALNTNNGHHSLSWKTYTEESSDYFVVERSADGRKFNTLQKLACTGHAGSYGFTDATTPAGTTYYRLKIVDGKDGSVSYSNTVSGRTAVAAIDVVSVYPNPASGTLNLHVAGTQDATGSISLTDAAGKEVKRMDVTGAAMQMDIHGVPAGLYFLNYRQDGLAQTIKVTVQ